MSDTTEMATSPHPLVVKLASPGLDALNLLPGLLPSGTVVEPYLHNTPLKDQVGRAQVLLVRSVAVDREVIDAASNLRLIQRPGNHVEGVDIGYAQQKGVHVCRIPEGAGDSTYSGSVAVAEHGFTLIMALAKKLPECQEVVNRGGLGEPAARMLAGANLGLVGLGKTGTALVPMAKGMGMKVASVKRTPDPEAERSLGLEWLGSVTELPRLLAWADVVSIHLPLTAETQGAFSRQEFNLFKSGALLLNIARADLVDRDSLTEALDSGAVGGYAADVWWDEPADPSDPLLARSNVLCTPHMAGVTVQGQERAYSMVADNIRRVVIDGDTPLYEVNP